MHSDCMDDRHASRVTAELNLGWDSILREPVRSAEAHELLSHG
eukprot:CAMPEP_0177746260 /NCGR_PEP_ID=MMETSP0484_2-20121128/30762_1 /TAXON_ID=354590 /ORGANISM="Rhodomonas lens, Strain RHODO" /LENGTH=42 /DNA_ID= /DNA_START= /DNA_END= /DNA_ORIENTATION=